MTSMLTSTGTTRVEFDGTRPDNIRLLGGLAFLLLSFPVGIAWFVVLVTLIATGIGTAITWIGIPLLALALLASRFGAQLERARVAALLGGALPASYRMLPDGDWKARWKARFTDPATRRDLAYLFLLFPIGVLEFSLTVTFWSLALGLLALPIYWRFLPDGAFYFPSYDADWHLLVVDSTVEALPWAAFGVVVTAFAIVATRWMAGAHARLARALLGPRGDDPVAG